MFINIAIAAAVMVITTFIHAGAMHVALSAFKRRSWGIWNRRADIRTEPHDQPCSQLVGGTPHCQNLHPVRVEITSWDRVGLLRDITTMVSGEKVNIAGVVTAEPGDGTAVITLTLYTTGVSQLSRLFSRLDGIKGVLNVNRAAAGTQPSAKP